MHGTTYTFPDRFHWQMEITLFWKVLLAPAQKNSWPESACSLLLLFAPLLPLPCPYIHPQRNWVEPWNSVLPSFWSLGWEGCFHAQEAGAYVAWHGGPCRRLLPPVAKLWEFLCGCHTHFNLDFMFHASLNMAKGKYPYPHLWECLPLSIREAMVLHNFPSQQLCLCPPHRLE